MIMQVLFKFIRIFSIIFVYQLNIYKKMVETITISTILIS